MKNVEFISSNGQGINSDLLCVKSYLSKSEYCEYKFFSSKEKSSKNPFEKKGLRTRRRVFCNNVVNAVCADASIPVKLKPKVKNSNRILLMTPYDYHFKLACLLSKGKRVALKKSFSNFTHILPGSKFNSELLNNFYQINGKVIENVNLPFADSLSNERKQNEMRKTVEYYFPKSKGKKIISVITTVSRLKKQTIDIKSFLDSLNDEYFVLTNCIDIFEKSSEMPNDYSESMGYVKNLILSEKLLYISDCLITNIGRLATAFCITGKPAFCMKYRNNSFEKYMNKMFNELFLDSINDKTVDRLFESTEVQKKFREYFSYNSDKNPCEVIENIIN